jgi:hypothetical protein
VRQAWDCEGSREELIRNDYLTKKETDMLALGEATGRRCISERALVDDRG